VKLLFPAPAFALLILCDLIDFVILAYLHGNAESLKNACVLWAIIPIQLKFVVLEWKLCVN
jgi:hypothetical protein